MKKTLSMVVACLLAGFCWADKSLIQLDKSPHAKMQNVGLDQVRITDGFWQERQAVNREVSLEVLWELATDEEKGYPLNNFKIADGLKKGKHQGCAWQDAWIYKWIETACYVYASTGDQSLMERMDSVIPIIAKAQEEDGYIATQVSAGKFKERWLRPDNHELYNMGHLLTAAAVHYRITGKTELLDVANKAAAFCLKQFREHPDVMWEYPLNPSIIMGAVELYRTTGNVTGLELAKHIVDLRGSTYPKGNVPANWGRPAWGAIEDYKGGRDLYQNFIPLRKEKEVVGHAVFFTYLYAGATDVYLETGDRSLLDALQRLWTDLTEKKMYITGGVSPVHKGPVTRSFVEGERQVCRWEPIHEGIVAPYDLPNATAYNETCGMVGNMMWNWRMLQVTGDARYAEIMELSWYNSILSGVQLAGDQWSYTNPLRWHGKEHELWSLDYHHRHVPGLKHICCPTNLMRNLAAYHAYLYSVSQKTLWLHHYAASELDTMLPAGEKVKLVQETNYPWDGNVKLTLHHGGNFAINLRIPGWADGATLKVNGKKASADVVPGQYVQVSNDWKTGDTVELDLPMEVQLMISDYLIEAARGQVAVKRGPVVYCLESNDIPEGVRFEDVRIFPNAKWKPEFRPELLGGVTVLKTKAEVATPTGGRVGGYRALGDAKAKKVNVELIPYYSWNNREEPKMSVWLPLSIR
ncbi:MAG: glycoside hydrolase family 127 protein [Kiritimatiellales bacterium]|nr:glycoside hydrolase family 127 protein [Kiritimatiellales bacterium]